MKKLSIVITDFNGIEQTKRCLLAIMKSTVRPEDIIIVDHGTTDDTKKELLSNFPGVTRVQGSPELWWAGATNLGIKNAIHNHSDYIMLLNNDCYIQPNTIETIKNLIIANTGSIIAPVQKDLDSNKITSITPSSCFFLGFPTLPGSMKLPKKNNSLLTTKLIIGGRGVVIPSKVFSDIGYFDEIHLPHYGADHDFYIRARKEKIPLYTTPETFVSIDNSRTTLAIKPESLTFKEFIDSFYSTRSHRNIKHVSELFKKHYPIPKLHILGITLFAVRYTSVYLVKKLLNMH